MSTNQRKVVARYLDGRLVKGYTFDFGPAQPRFHVFKEPTASGPSTQVFLRDLKALFFVRDLVGNAARQDRQVPAGDAAGGHVEVRFRDGEMMVGTVEGSVTDTPGFFLVPADPESNNLRVYVLAAATRAVYPVPIVKRPSPRPTADPPIARSKPASVPTRSASASAFARPILPGRMLAWLAR
jgi:hypothetical protein